MKLRSTIFFFLFLTFSAFAQVDVDDGSNWQDRIYKGLGGGFSAGSNSIGKFVSISLNPVVGYMLASNASVGLTATYQNVSYSDIGLHYVVYGLNPFVRYNFNSLFAMGQFSYLNVPTTINSSERVFRERLLFGLGYAIPTGNGRGRINTVAMYDVLYKTNNGFASPWVFNVFFSF